jgi:plastocyanin
VPALTRFLVVLVVAGALVPSALAAPETVTIFDTGYVPRSVTVDRGDVVTWINNGADLHTVTSDEGTTMASGQMERGGVYATMFDKPGRYPYHDDLNPDLRAVVVVRDTAAPPASTEPPPPAGTQPPGFEPKPATTEVTPSEAAGEDSGDGGGRDVWVDVIAVLAVAAGAAAIFFWIVRRRSGGDDG